MRATAQFTIHSLNDIVTSATAPSSPYKGQLWVDTSKSPPLTMVWTGSAWKEQNDTDGIRTNVVTLTTKASNLETSLNGLKNTVSALTTQVDENGETIATLSSQVSTLEQTASGLEVRVSSTENDLSTLSTSVSTLTQTASELSAQVSAKVDETYGTSSSSFGWSLKSTGFYVYANAATVMSITSSGLSVVGAIDATSGSIGNLTIDGYLYFGGNSSYYISANYNDSNYYINLPGLRIDKASTAVFSGKLSAPSGTIGGFTISTTKLYKTKTTYNDSNEGVYVGTDGIGLGAGTFYVTSAGKLYATNAEISGVITATSGTIGGFEIGEKSLTNTTGGSTIKITSGDYSTVFGSNYIRASSGTGDAFKGWSLNLDQFSLTAYNSSTYSGIKITPTHKKRSSYTSTSNTMVLEACITSARDTYYNADSSSTVYSASPFIIGIPREYADSPYQPVFEWGAYMRLVSYLRGELVYDSYLGGKWYLKNAYTGTSYDMVTLLTHVNTHKFYFWKYTSSVSNDSKVSITNSTHGLSTVTGAIVIPREKSIYGEGSSLSGDNNLINKRANYGVYISGTTVYIVVDTNGLPNGFNCIIYGY